MALPTSQPVDGNGRTVAWIGWDPASGQFVVPKAGAGTSASGQQFAYGAMSVQQEGNSYRNITTKATTAVKSGAGYLHSIVINKAGSADTLTIYDNTAASGTVIATITVTASVNQVFLYDVAFSTGLTIVSGGTTAGDYTVTYR
jgi:hypothetical protein